MKRLCVSIYELQEKWEFAPKWMSPFLREFGLQYRTPTNGPLYYMYT